MPDVFFNALLYFALPLFIGHYVLLDFLQWREPKSRLAFSAIGSVLLTVSLVVMAVPFPLHWSGENYWLMLLAIFCVAPIVSVWEAGVLRVCGWKNYSEAFDATVRINRLIPMVLWVVLVAHGAFDSDPALQSTLFYVLVPLTQCLGLLAYANKGKGGSIGQSLATKAATLIIVFFILQPLALSDFWMFISEPTVAMSAFLVSIFLMSLVLAIVGWSTYATSTRKALEIGIVGTFVLITIKTLGIAKLASLGISPLQTRSSHFVLQSDAELTRAMLCTVVVMAYCFISFHLEGTIVRRARLVPSVICAAIFGIAAQAYMENRFTEATALLALAILAPLTVALIIRHRIVTGEKSVKLGDFGMAQVQMEAALNLLQRFLNGSELVVRCLVGLADATAAQKLFLQSQGYVEKALDTIGSGVRPRPNDLETLRRLVVDLHGKTGLSKTNVLQERLNKLVPLEAEAEANSDESATTNASNGAEKNGFTAQSATLASGKVELAASQTKQTPVAMPEFSIPLFNDSSLRALPPRVANLTANAPTWDKNSRDRVAFTPPPLAMPAFAKSSGMELVVSRDQAPPKSGGSPSAPTGTWVRPPAETWVRPPAGTWVRPPAEPNLFSIPSSSSWMMVSDQKLGDQKVVDQVDSMGNPPTATASFNTIDSISATDCIDFDSVAPGAPKRRWFHSPFRHKKRDRFDDDSRSVLFDWKLWAFKILILVCCPTLLAVSTGLNYLASRNRDLAEACMSSALTINQVVLGTHNMETAYAYQSLGRYYFSHSKDQLAFLNLRSALAIFDENQDSLPKTSDMFHQHNILRSQVAKLAEDLGDLETAAQTWMDVDTALSNRYSLVDGVLANPEYTYVNDRFRAKIQAARLRALQGNYKESCTAYSNAFSQRWSIADANFVPSKYSIDWSREVENPDFYLEAARAATNYALILDSKGERDKSWVIKRVAHLFATRYMQEQILIGMNNIPPRAVPLCATMHDTRVAMTVFATGHVSNLRVAIPSNHPYCDNCGLSAVEYALGMNLDHNIRLSLPVPVELICPVDIEIGFKNLPTKASESHTTYAYIP